MVTIIQAGATPRTEHILRPLNPQKDISAIADLVEMCFAGSLDQEGKRYLQDMRTAARTPGYLWVASAAEQWSSVPLTGYVWEEDGRIVGNLSLIPYRIQGSRNYLIANVAVHPDYRRRGIGRALTLEGIKYARSVSAPSVWLQVREENIAAIKLYEDLGFKEQARRTTWQSSQIHSKQILPAGIQIRNRTANTWETHKSWLERCYPQELRWNLPLKLNLLQPGFNSALYRLVHAISVQQWTAWQDNKLIGILTSQASVGFSGILWLATTQQNEDLAAQALLNHARQFFGFQRSFTIDFPAHHASTAIESAGFYARQTLIWMKIEFSE